MKQVKGKKTDKKVKLKFKIVNTFRFNESTNTRTKWHEENMMDQKIIINKHKKDQNEGSKAKQKKETQLSLLNIYIMFYLLIDKIKGKLQETVMQTEQLRYLSSDTISFLCQMLTKKLAPT